MGPVTVRLAQASDLVAIQDLYSDLDQLQVAAEPWLFRMPDERRLDAAEFDEVIHCDNCFLAVADQGGAVVGFIDASRHDPTDAGDVRQPWCGVDNVAVRSDRRRQGVGQELMQAAEAWAQQHGLATMRLNVYSFNAGAHAFYEQLGYRTLSLQMCKDVSQPRHDEEL